MFTLQNIDIPELDIPGLKLKPYNYQLDRSKFDLTLHTLEAEENLIFNFEYCTRLFKPATIERFARYFKRVVAEVTANADTALYEIDILSEEEKQQLLTGWNVEAGVFPVDKTIHGLFEEQVERAPDSVAAVSVLTVEAIHESPLQRNTQLSYRQLNLVADRVAHRLKERGLGPGGIVALKIERSVEMIAAILGVLKAGGAYLPIAPNYPQERVDYMVRDSGAKICLTDLNHEGHEGHEGFLYNCRLLTGLHANLDLPPAPSPAYIIYTSGTTGKPKGVMISHRNVVSLMSYTHRLFGFGGDDVWTMFHSYGFDFSVWEMYGALLFGGQLVVVSMEVARDPAQFMKLLQERQVTVLNQTPRAFYALADEVLNEGIDRLNLRVVIFGGEALNPAKLKRWHQRFPGVRLVNMFGITETTVHVTFKELTAADLEHSTSNIGKPLPGWSVFILDKYGCPVPPGTAGELCVGGAGVAGGYLNRPQLTADRFVIGHLSLVNSDLTNDRLYSSGDRGRWLANGDLEYLGRIDLQVKIRGFRIELGEIEHRLLAHDAVREAVVTDRRRRDGDTYLCAYVVPVDGGAADCGDMTRLLRDHLMRSLPDYMVPSFFVSLDKIPLTPNGKVDRKALPEPDTAAAGQGRGETEVLELPRNETEKKLVEIFAEVLELEPACIGVATDFFRMGGHSLKAVSLVNAIHQVFHVKIDIATVFQSPTIAELGRVILETGNSAYPFMEIRPQLFRSYYELSYAQKRLWVIQQMNPGSAVFNMPAAIYLEEQVEESAARTVLEQLVRRHDCFRTYFRTVEEEVVQVIESQGWLNLEAVDLSGLDGEEQQAQFARLMAAESREVFDLETPPLYRARLVQLGQNGSALIFNIHHIVFDGWSLELLRREFAVLYRSVKDGGDSGLEPLRIQYKDYAHWHNRLLSDGDGMARAREFWKEQLSGQLPVLSLPYDHAPEEGGGMRSAGFRAAIPGPVVESLKTIALDHNASLFMVLLAGFHLLLAHITGQEDIILGIPGAARQHQDLKQVMGLFVNTLILRNRVQPGQVFGDFLTSIRDNTMYVLEHQSYPLEMICEELDIAYPQLSVFFNKTDIGSAGGELADFDSRHIPAAQDTKFDLTLYLSEHLNGLNITCSYYAELFEPSTIEKAITLYTRILANISADPDQAVSKYHKSTGKRKLKKRATSNVSQEV
jgi:amino acid adenylation domain-containing protein